jgi:hypothetical protein
VAGTRHRAQQCRCLRLSDHRTLPAQKNCKHLPLAPNWTHTATKHRRKDSRQSPRALVSNFHELRRSAALRWCHGRIDSLADGRHAAQIASSFLGGAKIRKTDYVTTFTNEYTNIFRVLPVSRFDTDDDLNSRVYVSTAIGQCHAPTPITSVNLKLISLRTFISLDLFRIESPATLSSLS